MWSLSSQAGPFISLSMIDHDHAIAPSIVTDRIVTVVGEEWIGSA